MKRGKPLQRKTWMRARSAKTEARYAGAGGRRALVRRLLKERPLCEACVRIGRSLCTGRFSDTILRQAVGCKLRARDVHEILPRSAGGDILDETNLLCVCRRAHDWIHSHPREAMALGLKKSRYDGPVRLTVVSS